MLMFTVRVVLHKKTTENATPAVAYNDLHEQMEAAGFERKIKGSNDQWYEMPPGEYHLETILDLSSADVRDKAEKAIEAAKLGRKFAIMSMKVASYSWQGLDPA